MIENEREFWPVERRHDLRVRIVGVISGWKDAKNCRSESEKSLALKPIEIASGKVLTDEAEHDDKPAQADKLGAKNLSGASAPPAEGPDIDRVKALALRPWELQAHPTTIPHRYSYFGDDHKPPQITICFPLAQQDAIRAILTRFGIPVGHRQKALPDSPNPDA